MVIGISKSKSLGEIVNFIEVNDKFRDISIVSRQHMRLYKAEEAYKALSVHGCTKLRDLVIADEQLPTTEPDSDTSSRSASTSTDPVNLSNINATLDHILKEVGNDPKTLILVCGSFFIMSDVKQYFG